LRRPEASRQRRQDRCFGTRERTPNLTEVSLLSPPLEFTMHTLCWRTLESLPGSGFKLRTGLRAATQVVRTLNPDRESRVSSGVKQMTRIRLDPGKLEAISRDKASLGDFADSRPQGRGFARVCSLLALPCLTFVREAELSSSELRDTTLSERRGCAYVFSLWRSDA
jgi:hypothetical protein